MFQRAVKEFVHSDNGLLLDGLIFFSQSESRNFNKLIKITWKILFYNLLYIRNIKYCTFNTIFRQHNIHLVFYTCQHKYKRILCTINQVLNASFQDFWCSNINNHLIYFDQFPTHHEFLALNMYLSSFLEKIRW